MVVVVVADLSFAVSARKKARTAASEARPLVHVLDDDAGVLVGLFRNQARANPIDSLNSR